MTRETQRSQALRVEAATLDKHAARLRRRAEREAVRGCVFTAETLSLDALAHEAVASQLRVSAYAHEEE